MGWEILLLPSLKNMISHSYKYLLRTYYVPAHIHIDKTVIKQEKVPSPVLIMNEEINNSK